MASISYTAINELHHGCITFDNSFNLYFSGFSKVCIRIVCVYKPNEVEEAFNSSADPYSNHNLQEQFWIKALKKRETFLMMWKCIELVLTTDLILSRACDIVCWFLSRRTLLFESSLCESRNYTMATRWFPRKHIYFFWNDHSSRARFHNMLRLVLKFSFIKV